MTIQLPNTTVKRAMLKQHQSTYKPKLASELPFTAWDGEGYTDPEGVHHFMLYGCSTGNYVKANSLSAAPCFELMLNETTIRKSIHVIFAGGYDMVMMIHKYPTHIAERILKGQVTWYNGYRHEYFKSKYLKLSDGTRSIILYDVFTFFSTSFVKACREYLPTEYEEDFKRIEATKLQRDTFTLESLETDVIPYWQQELKYLVELMNTLRKRLLDAGINTRQWHGPGAVASTVLRDRGIRAHMSTLPPEVCSASQHAYYGGRFEQHQIGYHNAPVWQYDIRSAYPAAITRLPSLAGLEWKQIGERAKTANKFNPYGIYQISYNAPHTDGIREPQPLPWRDNDKSIFYPPDIHASWYWGIELETVRTCKPDATITIHDGWIPTTHPVDFPFQWVKGMYEDRARNKRAGNPVQLAQKLALNSLYGKLAQSKGARLRDGQWQLPRYHQLEWAGWITAATRAHIFRAITLAGSSLIAVETDAVYTTKPLSGLTCSPALGDWEMDEAEAILYIQSGVYFKKVDGSWKLKSRGFEPRNQTFERWYEVMSRLPHAGPVQPTVINHMRRFGTLATSNNFAKWYEQDREHNILAEQGKRVHRTEHCHWCTRGMTLTDCLHPLVIPVDRINSAQVSSMPHKLPWVDDGMRGWETFGEDFVVFEDGMYSLEFGDEDL